MFDSDDDENDDVPIDFSATVEPEREEKTKVAERCLIPKRIVDFD